ncbi:MAG: helix-turn-helix transcriptional regulator [Kribbellaceae bacterium]|nr:helix-turn-helix transcriptional regulator [Kribbellaceae bacterium]
MLEPLGVDEATLAVYSALLRRPEHTPEQVAADLERPVEEVRRLLDRLRELELIIPTWTSQGGEHAVHPRIGLSILAHRRRDELSRQLAELEESEGYAEKLAEQYSELLISRTEDQVEVLEGRTRASRRIEQLGANARESFWSLIPSQIRDNPPPAEESPDRRLLKRGIKTKFTYLESLAATKAGMEYCEWVHSLGGEVRTTPTLPLRLLVIDNEIAIMPLDPANHDAGAVVHRSPAVVSVALALFDAYWSRAKNPFEKEDLATNAPLTPQESEVLRLLAGGAKDEQVARLLGISLRTARRITAGLADRVDAASRFELGVAAAKRGWV